MRNLLLLVVGGFRAVGFLTSTRKGEKNESVGGFLDGWAGGWVGGAAVGHVTFGGGVAVDGIHARGGDEDKLLLLRVRRRHHHHR